MKVNSDKRIRAGYIAAFTLLFISYLITFYTAEKLRDQSQLVNYNNRIITNFESLLSGVKDAQRGSRGFFVVGDSAFLGPHIYSRKLVDSAYDNLKKLLNDEKYESLSSFNKAQSERFARLQDTIKEEFAVIEKSLKSFKTNNFIVSDSVRRFEYRNKAVMDRIDYEINDLQELENKTMQSRIQQIKQYIVTLQIIDVTSIFIAILLCIYSVVVYNKESAAKRKADQQAKDYSYQLEEHIKELRDKNEEINRLRSIEKFASTGRIARTIAHEVRNPLTNISLATEQLQEEVKHNDETELLFGMIERNATRINQLITDLLNSTKFAQLTFTKASIHQLLDDSLDLAKDRLDLKHIQVVKHYNNSLDEVEVDAEKMKIAFLNLIMNAIEAMEEGKGILTVSTAKEKGKCIIRVQDNGGGISEEHLPRIFEPYFTSKVKGSGLGLTNTQNIVLNHKGIIYAESELSKGSKFVVELECS